MRMNELKSEKGQKIIFLNVRSIYNNISELQLEFANCNLMCLCFCETWLNSKIDSRLIDIYGYKPLRLDRKSTKKGGGVITYVRNDFDVDQLHADLDVSNQDIEIMSTIIKRKFQRSLCVSVAYLPPTSKVELALQHLEKLYSHIDEQGYEWILGGDFNIDLNMNKSTRLIRNFAGKNTLTQLINKPTRTCRTRSSIIDHIYTNTTQQVKDTGVINYGLSDHDLLYVILKRNLQKKPKTSFRYRDVKHYHVELLEILIDETDWTDFYIEPNPELAWEMLIGIYYYCLDALAPIKEFKQVKVASDWTDSHLLGLIRERDYLRTEMKQHVNPNEALVTELKRKRNQVKRCVINAKRNYTR